MYGSPQLSSFGLGIALILSLLVGLFLATAQAQTPGPQDQVWSMPNPKDCGLITRLAPNLIGPGCLQSVSNIYFDEDWSMLRRNGYSSYNLTACTGTKPIRGLWPFNSTDGTKYIIAYSTGTMFYSNGDGTCNAITGLQNLSTTAEMQCVQALGYLNCTNGSDTPFRTNVNSTQTLTAAPLGTLIGTYRNRIAIAGVSGNSTLLYLSGELDPTDWTLNLYPNLSTSPVQINISGANDGVKVNCIMGQFQNQFLIGRDYDLYALSGYDNRDFVLRKISEQIGCVEPKSVQEVNNVLYWLSKRGVEGYTGTQILPVSYPIDPTIRQIIAASGNTRSQTLTTQADWQGGNLTASGAGAAMSATISPGNIVPSSFSFNQTVAVGGFDSWGSTTNISTSTIPGYVSLERDTFSFVNGAFDMGDFTNWTTAGAQWSVFDRGDTSSEAGACSPDVSTHDYVAKGYCFGSAGTTSITFDVLNSDGSALIRTCSATLTCGGVCTINSSNCSQYSTVSDTSYFTQDLSGLTTAQVKIRITEANGDSITSIAGVKGKQATIRLRGQNAVFPCSAGNPINLTFDTCGTANYIKSGSFTSRIFDTGVSTPIFSNFSATTSLPSAETNVAFYTQTSTSVNGAWSSITTTSDTLSIPSPSREFFRYRSDFSTTVSSKTPSLQSVGLYATTTGYYIASCVLVSTPTSWANLTVNAVNNSGSFTFWESTGATCGAAIASTATWNAQSPNSNIAVSTNTGYTATRVLFTVNSGTQAPTLNDITYNWNTGSNRPPVASMEYLDRYYLFYTTNTVGSAHNDHVAVYDYNQKWTLLSNVNAYSATKYQNKAYIGDSNATGTIYQFDSGQSDNGGTFQMFFQTADLDMGQPAQRKSFERAYLFLSAPANPSQSVSLNCNYAIDGSTVSYSFQPVLLSESREQTGYFSAKLPFPDGQVSQGHWVNFGCSYDGSDGPVRIYGIKIIYSLLGWD